LEPVGIIANPASGKDIRRLVAYGSVFDNNEKVNIVRRVLLGLDSTGVDEVLIMPDYFGIGMKAKEGLDIRLKVGFLDMPMGGDQDDSTRAAALLHDRGVACIVTLGGDGTNRAVAKTCGETPLLPISTGTNNVFPGMVESTLAGMAAGLLSVYPRYGQCCVHRRPRFDIKNGSERVDSALVDVVITGEGNVGSRALWDVSSLREIFLAYVQPGHIGFSSVGAHLGVELGPGDGLHIVLGEGGRIVTAPIGPGLICELPILSHRAIHPHEETPVAGASGVAALDGERELVFRVEDRLTISLNPDGPRVVDLTEVLRQAAADGVFMGERVSSG
jgi:hypothetical protein